MYPLQEHAQAVAQPQQARRVSRQRRAVQHAATRRDSHERSVDDGAPLRGQQQAVVDVQALGVAALSPGLGVAGAQQLGRGDYVDSLPGANKLLWYGRSFDKALRSLSAAPSGSGGNVQKNNRVRPSNNQGLADSARC
jgi:hypothetical protein